MTKRLLRLPEVMSKTGLKQSGDLRNGEAGRVPWTRFGCPPHTWVEEEVDQWISERIADRKPQKWQPIAAA